MNRDMAHVRVTSSITITIHYINNMDDTKPETYSNIVYRILDFCIAQQLWISAAHIAHTHIPFKLFRDLLSTLPNIYDGAIFRCLTEF